MSSQYHNTDIQYERPVIPPVRLASGGKKETSATKIEKAVVEVLADLYRDSSVFASTGKSDREIPSFQANDLVIGDVLGHGDFGQVRIVLHINNYQDNLLLKSFQDLIACPSEDCCPPDARIIQVFSSATQLQLHKNNITNDCCSDALCYCKIETSTESTDQDGSCYDLNDYPICDSNEEQGGFEDKSELDEYSSSINMLNGTNITCNDQNFEDLSKGRMNNLGRFGGSSSRYVVKQALQQQHSCQASPLLCKNKIACTTTESHNMMAAIDLACEAAFLRHLSPHPNIIGLHGTVGVAGNLDFMIILDRLTQTLSARMDTWRKQLTKVNKSGNVFKSRLFRMTKNKKRDCEEDQVLDERLLALLQVSKAIRHLHKHNIVYRDIKPDNIGLDIHNNVRVFDFGLARELKSRDIVQAPDGYDITGLTGSRRYMAPEVMLCQPYGLSADAYSFGILMWEVLALKTPFKQYSSTQLYDHVVVGHQRPKHLRLYNNDSTSRLLEELMQDCWSADRQKRPSFATIVRDLENLVESRELSKQA